VVVAEHSMKGPLYAGASPVGVARAGEHDVPKALYIYDDRERESQSTNLWRCDLYLDAIESSSWTTWMEFIASVAFLASAD
jgi:hypothetical protein